MPASRCTARAVLPVLALFGLNPLSLAIAETLPAENSVLTLGAVNVTGTKLAGIELATNLPDGQYLDRISGKEFEVAAGLVTFDLGSNQAIALTKK